EQLATQVVQAEAQYEIAQQLDSILVEALTLVEDKFNLARAGRKYEGCFLEKLKLNMRNGPLPPLLEQVKGSSVVHVLVTALDHWAAVTTDKDLLPRLLQVARQADADPWRDQVRNENTWQDLGQLQQLAREVKPQQQTPQTLFLLARRLTDKGGQEE